MKNRILRCAIILTAFLGFNSLFVTSQVYAITSLDDATALAMKEGVRQCYQNNVFWQKVDTSNKFDPKGSSIISKPSLVMDPKYETEMLLPNGNVTEMDSMNCHDLVFGTGSWEGYLSHYGVTVSDTDKTAINTMMTKLQYVPSGDEGSKKCFSIQMTGNWNLAGTSTRGDGNVAPQTQSYTSNEVCVPVKDGKIDADRFENGFKWSAVDGTQPGIYIQTESKKSVEIDFSIGDTNGQFGGLVINFQNGDSWDSFKQKVQQEIDERVAYDELMSANNVKMICASWSGISGVGNCTGGFFVGEGVNPIRESDQSGDAAASQYILNDGTSLTTATNAVKAITGSSTMGLTPAQAATLYQRYINTAQSNGDVEIACGFAGDSASASGYSPFTMVENGEKKNCFYRINGDDTAKYAGLQSAVVRIFSQDKLKLSDVFTQLTDILKMNIAATELQSIGSVRYDTVNGETYVSEQDMNSSAPDGTCKTAAKSMGWLLCTILKGIGDGVRELYTSFVEPALVLEPTLFGTSEENGTKVAWNTFRDMANVAIVILFLAVIFSQLTGVGIDNYGIKKILPKLILVAILMNLSYYICVALVDVSNIVGNGVQDIFANLPVKEMPSTYGVSAATKDVVSAIVLGVAVGGVAWGFSLATLLALVPTAVSVLVAIFFLFVLLAAREAAVVVMVVLSPLAFACFILPNTKKYFDKWLKIGEALLLVYPIVGVLVAGGNYVSKVLISTSSGNGNIATAVTAMLVGIVPVFFIPSVLRSSMSGLGNIGSKISNLGSRMGRGAANGVRNSEAFKMQQQRANERRALKMAGLKLNKDGQLEDTNGLRSKIAKSRFGKATGMQRTRDAYRQQATSMIAAKKNTEQYENLDVLNAQRTKDENMLKERKAEAEVGVPELTEELARQRAEARRSAQTLKSYQDQYATASNDSLLKEAEGAYGASGWLRQKDGAQRMAALMGAMINNGMEKDVGTLLENDKEGELGWESNASVRQMLAGTKEKHLKAYGKKGKGVSYTSFMEDLVDVLDSDGNKTGRRATLMQQYIDDKGNDFYKDLSDKTLRQLQKHGGLTNTQVVDVLSKATSQDAINVADEILKARLDSGESVSITGSQLTTLSPSSISTLAQSETGRQALIAASNDLVGNNRLKPNIDLKSRELIDDIRVNAGADAVWTAAEKRAQSASMEGSHAIDHSASAPTVTSTSTSATAPTPAATATAGPAIVRNESESVSVFEQVYSARAASAANATAQLVTPAVPTAAPSATPVVEAAPSSPRVGAYEFEVINNGVVPEQYQTMGIGQLFDEAGRTSTTDLGGVESAIMNYQGADFIIQKAQLPGLKLRTINMLASSDNLTHRQALLDATDQAANDPAILNQLGSAVKGRLNAFRRQNGRPPLP